MPLGALGRKGCGNKRALSWHIACDLWRKKRMYHLVFPRTRAGFKTRVSKIILVKDSNLNQGPLQEKNLGDWGRYNEVSNGDRNSHSDVLFAAGSKFTFVNAVWFGDTWTCWLICHLPFINQSHSKNAMTGQQEKICHQPAFFSQSSPKLYSMAKLLALLTNYLFPFTSIIFKKTGLFARFVYDRQRKIAESNFFWGEITYDKIPHQAVRQSQSLRLIYPKMRKVHFSSLQQERQ